MKAVISSEKYGFAKIDRWHKLLSSLAHNSNKKKKKVRSNMHDMGLEVSYYRNQNAGVN